jgi:hypothetical protein
MSNGRQRVVCHVVLTPQHTLTRMMLQPGHGPRLGCLAPRRRRLANTLDCKVGARNQFFSAAPAAAPYYHSTFAPEAAFAGVIFVDSDSGGVVEVGAGVASKLQVEAASTCGRAP